MISNTLAEEKQKRQEAQGHNPIRMFLETCSQEPNPETALRKFPQHLPSIKMFLHHCQSEAVPPLSVQHWGLKSAQALQSTAAGAVAFQTDGVHQGLNTRQKLGKLVTLNV